MNKHNFEPLHAWLVRHIPHTFHQGIMPWVFAVMFALGTVMSVLAVINYRIFGDLAAFMVALATFALMLGLHLGLKLQTAVHIGIAVAFVSVWVLIWNMGGLYSPRLAWLLLLPLAPFLFLGFRAGVYWLLAVSGSVVFAAVANIMDWYQTPSRMGDVYLAHNWAVLALVSLFMFVVPLAYHLKNHAILRELRHKRQSLIDQKAEIERAQAIRDRFITCVSHEMRTPMNAIMGLNEWLLYHVPQTTEAHKLIQHSAQSAEHLMTVINDALDYSQLKSGSIKLHRQVFDLHACVHNAFEMLVPKATSKQLAYQCHIHPSTPQWVHTDRHRLVQVLVNLLNNAIKFTPKGSVTLSLHARGHRVHFAVQDTGIGIAPELQHAIFNRFNQGHTNTQQQYGGNGLGLSISRQLVQLMHGSLQFSSALGQGSTFYFDLLLPAQQPPSTQSSRAQPRMASAHKAWVFLVVDDHPINRLLLRKVLASHWPQAHIVEATHGAEALAYVQAHTVHAVFMDMLMPVMNGIEATRAIRALPQSTARTVIVGLTANVNAEDLATFKGAGLDSLMLKPFNLAQLCTDIDQLLTLRW